MVVLKSPFSLFLKNLSHTVRHTFRPWAPAAVGSSVFLFNMAGYFLFNKSNEEKKANGLAR